jgi:hypothetical protein
MRKTAVIALLVLILTGLAAAQIPVSGNVFFGYSYYRTNPSGIDTANTNGWEGSIEGKFLPLIGIVGDVSGHYGNETFAFSCPVGLPTCNTSPNVNIAEHNYLIGPRLSVSVGKYRPFAEALFGVGHINANAAGSDTSFATALGGGLDYKLIKLVAWRIQGDYVQTHFFGARQDNIRISTGIAIHF